MIGPKARRLATILFALYCVSSFPAAPSADIHLVTVMNAEYGGYPRGKAMHTEVWLSAAAEHRIYKNKIFITRYDKGIQWIIDMDNGTYKEVPIDSKSGSDESEDKLHNEGYKYEPEFDWFLQETNEDTVLCGLPSKKYILDGDADNAEKIIEIWASDDMGTDDIIHGQSLHYLQGRETADLLARFPELKDKVVLYERSSSEGSLGSTRVIVTEIIKLEVVPPAQGIYQLPQGLKRIE